jgi:hypothetical protein
VFWRRVPACFTTLAFALATISCADAPPPLLNGPAAYAPASDPYVMNLDVRAPPPVARAWLLDAQRNVVCMLPCRRDVPVYAGYRVEMQDADGRVSIADVPADETYGGKRAVATATPVRGHPSEAVALAVTGVPLLLLGAFAIVSSCTGEHAPLSRARDELYCGFGAMLGVSGAGFVIGGVVLAPMGERPKVTLTSP